MRSDSSKWLEKASHSIHASEEMLQVDIDSADYDLDSILKAADVELMLQQAREFLEAARKYLSESGK